MQATKSTPRILAPWRIAFVCLLLAFAVVAGTKLGRWSGHSAEIAAPTHPLRLVAEDANLGDLWENIRTERTLRIANDGDEEITIQSFQASCSCTDITPPI